MPLTLVRMCAYAFVFLGEDLHVGLFVFMQTDDFISGAYTIAGVWYLSRGRPDWIFHAPKIQLSVWRLELDSSGLLVSHVSKLQSWERLINQSP